MSINNFKQLTQRLRRWTNAKPILIQRLLSAGIGLPRKPGTSLVFYPRPIEEWFSLSHDELGQSPPLFRCVFN